MNTIVLSIPCRWSSVTAIASLVSFVLLLTLAKAEGASALLDDYSDANGNRYGGERILVTDATLGSKSHATQTCEDGVLTVKGELAPGRGVPAFITAASLLAPEGKAGDLSAYAGVRLRVKVEKGTLLVQVSSSEIQNFDYHTSGPIAVKRGEFQEIRVPFKEMKRAWSEQTALDLKSVTSVNLVVFGTAREPFAYEVDEIGFY